MTTETTVPEVDPEARIRLLRSLAHGRKWTAARAASRLREDVAQGVAAEAGWPDVRKVREAWMSSLMPAPRAGDAEPEAPEDHQAVERALALARTVRSRHHERVARLTGRWSHADLLEVALALASMLPAPLDPEVALAWLDLPAEEWPEPVLVVEVARWEAGCRDATAEAARVERDRRGS